MNSSPPSSTTTPFLSELIEMKMKRANMEAIENDYIDNPLLPTTPNHQSPQMCASDDDVIRRALSLTNSLPGRLDFHPGHHHPHHRHPHQAPHSMLMMQPQRQTPQQQHRMLVSPAAMTMATGQQRPETAPLTSHPPPVPPRPLKSLSCGDGVDLSGGISPSPAAAASAMTSPPMFRRKPASARADPPPRPPKSPDVIALMMSHHHQQPTTTTPSPPPSSQFRASHPSLRDRRGDVIEPSNHHHRQQRHHQRSQKRSNADPVVTAQPIRHQPQQKPKKTSDKEAIRIEDDVTREKERLKNDVSGHDDAIVDKITIANRKLPSLPMSQEEMTSCPHCGKCLHQQQVAEKQLVVTSQASAVDKARSNRERRQRSLEFSCTECVEHVTCVSGVKCCFYHCADDSDGDRLWADKPCACHGVDCRLRWMYLVGLSFCFPCLLCYPLMRAVTRPKCTSCCCHDHYMRGGAGSDDDEAMTPTTYKMKQPKSCNGSSS